MVQTIVGYTDCPWDHALVVLRLTGPISQTGLRFLRGNEYPDDYPVIAQADVVVVQRDFPRYEDKYRQIVAYARSLNKPVVYEIDDLLWALPPDHPDYQNRCYSLVSIPMLQAVKESDAVTVPTPGLYGYIRSINPNVWLLPNYLNDRIWPFRLPKTPERVEFPIVIGYLGGKGVHEHDLRTILPVIQRVQQCYGQAVSFRFWGTVPPPELLGQPSVEHIPLSTPNYAEYASYCLQQECDILMAPLQPHWFNQCKSWLKFLEYAALGRPGVYSRIDPYQMVVKHGKNGFLASTIDEWYQCLVQLIENPYLRSEMSRNAQDSVRRKWLLSSHAREWAEVYERVSSRNAREKAVWRVEDAATRIIQQSFEWQQAAAVEIERQGARIVDLETQLAESQARLLQITSSRTGRLMQMFNRLRLLVLPQKSLRARVVAKGVRVLSALRSKCVFSPGNWG